VVLIGIAPEKASVWRSWPPKGQPKAANPLGRGVARWPSSTLSTSISGMGNGEPPSGRPMPLSHRARAQRPRLRPAAVGESWNSYEALDNGFLSGADPTALQKTCDRWGPAAVQSFFGRWGRRLSSPFTRADGRAGYLYELAFRRLRFRTLVGSIDGQRAAGGLKG